MRKSSVLVTILSLPFSITSFESTVLAQEFALPNSNYAQLRNDAPEASFRVENFSLKRDAGLLTLRSGIVTLLNPVLNRTVEAVFIGDGLFHLKPSAPLEAGYIRMSTGHDTIDEEFDSAVLVFTDETAAEIRKVSQGSSIDGRAADVLQAFRRKVRHRNEHARSLVEDLLAGDEIPNLDAEILAALYNPRRAGSFSAYLHGRKHSDLRFLLNPAGALPGLRSPDEVAVVNFDPGGDEEGIWYFSHFEKEWASHTASSSEDKRRVIADAFRIETSIDKHDRFTASTEVRLRALGDGERMIPFALLPSLRVTRVTDGQKKPVTFIQTPPAEDSAFWVVLPEALGNGAAVNLRIEYSGNKVVHKEGNGNFSVGARENWYPVPNPFVDRATYSLLFRVPKQYTLVSVGKSVKNWKEDNQECSEWASEVPLAVAGFNYAEYVRKATHDEKTRYDLEAYATRDVPDYLQSHENPTLELNPTAPQGQTTIMAPSRLAQSVLADAENSIRLYENWFGPAPYERLAITQQPEFNFGQSWPTLVYLPVSAFLDTTQRFALLGKDAFRFAEFIQEVTPHEVAHQWWGHLVGWSSYHDQWLSEGFADFSAGIFLQATEKPDKYAAFLERSRKSILEKNEFGRNANDAGPLWMGLRLSTPRTRGAYNRLIYPKGAFVLHMLRWMMYDMKNGDAAFKAMMQDYVKTYSHRNASTEDFQKIVAKHIGKPYDLDADGGQMAWFFRQWVYGNEIPRYHLDYSVKQAEGGKALVTGRITQSDVSPGFRMPVAIYLDFDGRIMLVGRMNLMGSATSDEFKVTMPQKPRRVMLNYYQDVLASATTAKEL